MSERLAVDIAADLRAPGPWPSESLLCEAADKLEGLIELLATAERERDEALAEVVRLRANQLPAGGRPRGTCSVCGRSIALLPRDGTIGNHRDRTRAAFRYRPPLCEGAYRPPMEASDE